MKPTAASAVGMAWAADMYAQDAAAAAALAAQTVAIESACLKAGAACTLALALADLAAKQPARAAALRAARTALQTRPTIYCMEVQLPVIVAHLSAASIGHAAARSANAADGLAAGQAMLAASLQASRVGADAWAAADKGASAAALYASLAACRLAGIGLSRSAMVECRIRPANRRARPRHVACRFHCPA